MARMDILADAVAEGDFLPDLDNGYVVENEPADDVFAFTGMYSSAIGREMVAITFHDDNGDECYLILPNDHRVKVERN